MTQVQKMVRWMAYSCAALLCLGAESYAGARCADRVENGIRYRFDPSGNSYTLRLNHGDASSKEDLLSALSILADSRGFTATLVDAGRQGPSAPSVALFSVEFAPNAIPTGEIGGIQDVEAFKEGVLASLEAVPGAVLRCRVLSYEILAGPRPVLGGTN